MRELRFKLDGRRLVFPEGRPFCLACGEPPAGTRPVWFEGVTGDDPKELGKLGAKAVGALTGSPGLGAGMEMLRTRITFDAPLCEAHRRAALRLSLATPPLALLTGAVFVAGCLAANALHVPDEFWLVAAVPAAVPGFFAYRTWTRKDRAGLSCQACWVGTDEIVLRFKD